MAVISEDNPGPNVLRYPNDNGSHGSDASATTTTTTTTTAMEHTAAVDTPTMLGTLQPEGEPPSKELLLQRQEQQQYPTVVVDSQTTPLSSSRPAEINWARVRQKVIGQDHSPTTTTTELLSDQAFLGTENNVVLLPYPMQKQPPILAATQGQQQLSSIVNALPESHRPYPVMEGSGPVSTGLRGVLGFRTVVVQRTQLRKMEKEIEKALTKRQNEYYQPRSRNVARIGTGTRGMSMLPGASYNIMATPEPFSIDRSFVDDMSDILNRWRNLTVEVPCKTELLRTMTKMLLADRAEPLSRPDSLAVLNLFDQMRQLFPLQSEPEDLQDVLWCLNLMSKKYSCKKERVANTLRELLAPSVLAATTPLSPRNINALLSTLVLLLKEQSELAQETQDPRIKSLATEIMDRIRIGDLGLGKELQQDRASQELNAQVAFLRGLIECLRSRDHSVVHFVLHELIPNYWIDPDSKSPMVMEGPIAVFGQVASEFILNAPTAYADGTELTKSLILDMTIFLEEFMQPAGLSSIISRETVAALARFNLLVFSIEYLETPPQESIENINEPKSAREDGEASPRVSMSTTDADREQFSRTPPRSPLSPKVSGENFQSHNFPPTAPGPSIDEQSIPVVRHAREYFDGLWSNGYQDVIIEQLKIETENISFARLVNLYHRIILGSATAASVEILAATLSTFFSKLVAHQPCPNERLSKLLLQLSIYHRAAFFKPMIACVASDSTQFVTDYLCILSCLETHMRLVDLYMRDTDLICVIMMTDVGYERPRQGSPTQALKWGSCTVGQCVIVLEFIYAIKRLARSGDNYDVEVGKMFLIDLERKLGLYLSAKEKTILVPRPIRVMLCLIFYEIRMLCKTIHRPGWLPRILDWATNHNLPTEPAGAQGGPFGISDTMRLRIKHIYSSVDGLVGERKDQYSIHITASSQPTRSSSGMSRRRSSAMGQGVVQESNAPVREKVFVQPKRTTRMSDIRLDETVAVLTLLITVHSAIHANEYLQLIDPLWNLYCLESRPKVAASAAFLFVKCADISPKMIHSLISRDLNSDDSLKRLSAIERLNVLFDHRNVLLSQPYVTDPSSRGPFRNATVQVPFVCSEVGSNRYTMDEPRWLTELKNAGNFPEDIRMRFQEMGWGERDQQEMENTRRAQTPLALSWTGYLDEDYVNKANFGKTYTILPRDRHATVLIPVLNALNLGIIDLLDDKTIGVRVAAGDFLWNYIRNEPVLFVRSFFAEIVHARPDRQKDLITRLHTLITGTSKLPPAFAFALFNHLLGLLKWFQRNSKPLGIEILGTVLPLLADVVSSTNDIVYKDLKRNKVDTFFANLGRFWFKPNVIPESMFPNRLTDRCHVLSQLDIPLQLFQMAMVNINQIQFTTSFLVRFPLEAPDIKGNIGRFSRMPRLTATETTSKLEDNQFLPDVSKQDMRFVTVETFQERNIRSLSSLRARSWLSFILNLIQRMDKDESERLELMTIFNGVNVILLEHGDDLGIVGQTLDIYVTAATHLRRFFASHNGYHLIFPALFKIYCDSTTIQVVQETIDATFYRFYQIHQEAFVLQSLGAIVPLMLRSMTTKQSEIMTHRLFTFLEALDQPTTTFQSRSLGVQSLSEPYLESSSFGGPQLEIPQWMASFISKDSKFFQSSNILQKQEFSLAESIKLFLAVIAFDPGSVRSEQFVRVFKDILPYFLDREPLLTTSGLDSLIDVFARFSRSAKPLVPQSFVAPVVAPRQTIDTDDTKCDLSRFTIYPSAQSKGQAIKGKTWAQNDRVAIKHEFMCLIQHFCDRGGQLADSQHQQMAVLVRSIVKDYTTLKIPCTTEWIKDYIKSVILPVRDLYQSSRAALYLVAQFSSVIRSHYKFIDFSGLFDGLLLIARDDRQFLRHFSDLAHIIRDKMVNPALVCGVKDDWLSESPYISQARYCSSLVDLVLAMIYNADTDTISELEQAAPTPRMMAYIVIPLCLRFESRFHSNCLDILEMQFWLRMLGLTVKAAEYDPTSKRSSRTAGLFAPVFHVARATRKQVRPDVITPMSPQHLNAPPVTPMTTSVPQTPGHFRIPILNHGPNNEQVEDNQPLKPPESVMNASPGLLIDFIALRIIMVRGERYLSYHPGCWLDIFNIVKKYFSVHSHGASSFSGGGGHAHDTNMSQYNSSHGSGPNSPNIGVSYPTTPRADGPFTPQPRSAIGGFPSPFPLSSSRYSGEMTPGPASMHSRDNTPVTALGYILWSFAETILFNRLPLMVMMRPFLLDQLRQVDYLFLGPSGNPFRSFTASGPNSPAFFWPSPAFGPSSGLGSTPGASPMQASNDNMASPSLSRSSSKNAMKSQPKNERRKQWKSWSQPTHSLNAFTELEKPIQGAENPMSPCTLTTTTTQQHHRQRSFMSSSDHGANMSTAPRISIHNIRHHRQHRSETDNKSGLILPRILVVRANRSMEHVSMMLNQSSDGLTAYSEFGVPMYPEKRSSFTGGSSRPMASPTDKRDSSQSLHADQGHGSDYQQQFLQPGKYERQPSSPGFGSMFLAREAAIRGPTAMDSPGSRSQHLAPLAVPSPHTMDRQNSRVSISSNEGSVTGSDSGDPAFVIGSPRQHLSKQDDTHHLTVNTGGSSSAAAALSPTTANGPPRSRSILKPRIITTSPPKLESSPRFGSFGDMTSTPVSQQPSDVPWQQPMQRVDTRQTDDGVSSLSGGVMVRDRRPSLSSQGKADYKMACLRARTKIFMQNIEEETRVVLACFPAVFSIGVKPTLTTATTTDPAAAATGTAAGMATSASPSILPTDGQAIATTETSSGAQVPPQVTIHSNEQARSSASNLSVPILKTPSITIQDQSFLAPSPINPLPSALEGGEHLFRTSARQSEVAEGSKQFSFGSPPPSTAKERRSKSVIFQNQLFLGSENAASTSGTGTGAGAAAGVGAGISSGTFSRSNAASISIGTSPPILALTASSPPLPRSPALAPTERVGGSLHPGSSLDLNLGRSPSSTSAASMVASASGLSTSPLTTTTTTTTSIKTTTPTTYNTYPTISISPMTPELESTSLASVPTSSRAKLELPRLNIPRINEPTSLGGGGGSLSRSQESKSPRTPTTKSTPVGLGLNVSAKGTLGQSSRAPRSPTQPQQPKQ
ncbi:hypothetical protein BGZ83_009603 [Gryganskiella cystojenkinii]|nr:hypothetical protein BGZ83_009603 [Gryganskiella cystojenkinii]